MRLRLKQFLSKLVNTPMIIESGSEGVWTWRKWSNGVGECWCNINEGSIAFSSLWTYAYYSAQLTRNYPTNFFLTAPIVTSSCQSNAGLNYITVTGNTAENVTYYITSSKAETRTCSVHLHAIGKWAEISDETQTFNFLGYAQSQMTKQEIQALIENSGNQFRDNDTWTPDDLE